MIAVDTSAIIAVLKREPDCAVFENILATTNPILMSAASYVEASMVAFGASGSEQVFEALDAVLKEFGVEIVSFDEGQAREARSAFQRFGKGRHPAALNFGDCMSYGLAKTYDIPLLFKGDDFTHTDVRAAASWQSRDR